MAAQNAQRLVGGALADQHAGAHAMAEGEQVGGLGVRIPPLVQGPRALIITSALLSAAGFLWQSQTGADAGYMEGLLGPAIVMSAGMGLLITPITTPVTSGVPAREAGAASGLMNATRQIGGAIGLAALVTLAATVTGTMSAYQEVFTAIAVVCAVVAATACVLPAPPHAAADN